jgi:hypothetical protein
MRDQMRKQNVKLLGSFFFIAVIAVTFCGAVWAQKGIRHIHPPTRHPSPRPPQQALKGVAFYKWNSKDVIRAFKNHGLEVADMKPGFTVGAPLAKEKTLFLTPSFGKDIGSLVASYNSEDALDDSVNYYAKMNTNPVSPAWWIFRKDNVLVLISGRVPEDRAREYERVLINMIK